jgi:hypothetical protein
MHVNPMTAATTAGCRTRTIRSIPKTVRCLHIALAAVLLGAAGSPIVRADETCLAAADGTACLDDDDPCTVDRCAGGACAHVDVVNRATCEPLLDAYRRTLGLGDLVDELAATLSGSTLPEATRAVVMDALGGTADDLARASDALAGRADVPAPGARAAFGIARLTPPRVRLVVKSLKTPGVQSAIGPAAADLARRVRFLYRSTNQFKRELRRLQRVSGQFAR